MHRHRSFGALLPWPLEVAIVVVIVFGKFILDSSQHVALVLNQNSPPTGGGYDDSVLLQLFASELLLAWIAIGFLRYRGWMLVDFGLRPTFRQTLAGFGLVLVFYAIWYAIWPVFFALAPGAVELGARFAIPAAIPSLAAIVAFSALNAAYEELFLCGYLMTAISRGSNATAAIVASVLVRLSYHLYQGPIGVLSILILGIGFSLVFARTRMIWPLIVAHFILDVVGLSFTG